MISVSAPQQKLPRYCVEVPPSKYLANRLLLLAAVSLGSSVIKGMPKNADMDSAMQGLSSLSAKITLQSKGEMLQDAHIVGFAGVPRLIDKYLYTGDNGTFTRLVTPWAMLAGTDVLVKGSAQMNARPMKKLLQALMQMGGQFRFANGQSHSENEWKLPFVCGGGLQGGLCSLSASESSQYFSSLLLVGPALPKGIKIIARGNIASKSYINMTKMLIEKYGQKNGEKNGPADVGLVQEQQEDGHIVYSIASSGKTSPYRGFTTDVSADASSATYFLALGALGLGRVYLPNFFPESYAGLQGEAQFFNVLKKMGATIEMPAGGGIEIFSTKKLRGITINMRDMPDAVPTLAVVAAAAEGTTLMQGIGHLRHKESNRMEGLATELRKAGVLVEVSEDAMAVTGGTVQSATFSSLGDHRLAMAFSLLSLFCKKVVIEDEKSVEKTFPTYFSVLERLGFVCKKND